MSQTQRTPFYERHEALGVRIVEFGGWDMPIQYPSGTVKEHLATRKGAGLFDVSHMGRFIVRGRNALPFLQHVLTNNAEALDGKPIDAQYTVIPNETGGAVDDAYLCRFDEEEYLLVLNASNRRKDWDHLQSRVGEFGEVELSDRTEEMVMLALQGGSCLRACWSSWSSPAGFPSPSGTMAPYWVFEDEGSSSRQTDQHKMRPICLAYMDSNMVKDEEVQIEIRGKAVDGVIVGRHLRSDTPPRARPIVL